MIFANRFAGRRAIVTGGASGIGLAVARRIVAESGAVCVWDRDMEALERVAGVAGSHAVRVDVTQPASVESALLQTMQAMGGVDVLVASAGITGPTVPLADYPIEDWRRVIDVNLHGVFYCNRAVVPAMQAQGYGRIVNVASIAGKEGNPNASAYSASKAGVIALTKSLAKECAAFRITVNAITPAAVETALFAQMSQEHIDYMRSKIPMGRFGTVDEIAALICWLASEECAFSTGAVFDASGGRATY